MSNLIVNIPMVSNEPVLNYRSGSKEKLEVKSALDELQSNVLDIGMTINGKKVTSDVQKDIFQPHNICLLYTSRCV